MTNDEEHAEVPSSRSFLSRMVFISSSRACTFLPKVSVAGGGGGDRSVSNRRGSTKAILRACSMYLPFGQHLLEQG